MLRCVCESRVFPRRRQRLTEVPFRLLQNRWLRSGTQRQFVVGASQPPGLYIYHYCILVYIHVFIFVHTRFICLIYMARVRVYVCVCVRVCACVCVCLFVCVHVCVKIYSFFFSFRIVSFIDSTTRIFRPVKFTLFWMWDVRIANI